MTQPGMKWHYIYNIYMILFSSVFLFRLISIFIYDIQEDYIFLSFAAIFLLITSVFALLKTRIGFILTKIVSTLYFISGIALVLYSCYLIYDDLMTDSGPWNGLGVALAIMFIFVSTAIIAIGTINFVYYKKRKHLFIKSILKRD